MTVSEIGHHSFPKLRRRDFLAYGAGLAILPSTAWGRRQSSGGLAIGYCDETPEFDVPGSAPVAVVAADRLASGEARLARRSARITVHGLVGDAEGLRRRGIRAVDLLVRYASSDDEFRAWSWELLPVENAGTANSFTVPVDGGLGLVLELETFGHERFETRLVTGREAGQPKLRTGHYLIAPGSPELQARRFDPAGSEPFIALSVEALDESMA